MYPSEHAHVSLATHAPLAQVGLQITKDQQ